MPSSIQDTIKDLASSLKDIKVSKSYKEDSPIPWKRLLATIGVSMAIVILIIVVAISIMHDMDIPELGDMMRMMDGRSWHCDSDSRKALREAAGLDTDGDLHTSYDDSLLFLDFGLEIIRAMPIDGYIKGYIGATPFIVYCQEGNTPSDDILVLIINDEAAAIYTNGR